MALATRTPSLSAALPVAPPARVVATAVLSAVLVAGGTSMLARNIGLSHADRMVQMVLS